MSGFRALGFEGFGVNLKLPGESWDCGSKALTLQVHVPEEYKGLGLRVLGFRRFGGFRA